MNRRVLGLALRWLAFPDWVEVVLVELGVAQGRRLRIDLV